MISAPGEQVAGSTVTIEVRVTSTTGQDMAGQTVTFTVTGGSASPTTATTNGSGVASTSWTLGTSVGTQTLTATASSRSANVSVTTTAGPAASFEKVSGDNQATQPGAQLAQPLVVAVKDAFGNPKAGEALTAAVTGGGGALTAVSANTGADGLASMIWVLGPSLGTNTVTVTHALGTVTFNATAQAGAPAVVEKVAGDNQSAEVGTPVAVQPKVRVTDAGGNPVEDVTVTFAVASGGGSVLGATSITAADGTAEVGAWTLGPDAGANTLTATVAGVSPVTFTATGTTAGSAYTIDLRFIGSVPSTIQAAFETAKARWERVIVGDLQDSNLNSAAGECLDAQPAVNETVDDLLIFAEVAEIDGVGNTLGQAGPCYVRTTNGTTLMGVMTFDEADLQSMADEGTLTDVIIHEMGHVIGIGTLWENRALLADKGTDDPYFIGTLATLAYVGMGGTLTKQGVPVENTGEEGTRDGHWRESIFDTELMTGYISAPGNPLSILTVQSLADQGYTVDTGAADTYTLPTPTAAAAAAAARRPRGVWERLLRPIAAVTPNGTRQPLRRR